MPENHLTTESPDLKGRWIRYVHTDEDTGRDHVAVTQIVAVEIKYQRPAEHRSLDHADRLYVEWMMSDNTGGKISQLDVMTLSPVQVISNDDAEQMISVEYSALGKPMKVTEFSMASVQEVLTTINRLIEKNPDKASILIEHYKMIQEKEKWYFPKRS